MSGFKTKFSLQKKLILMIVPIIVLVMIIAGVFNIRRRNRRILFIIGYFRQKINPLH